MLHDYHNQSKPEEPDPARVIASPSGPIQRHFSVTMTTGLLCFVLSLVFYYCTVFRVQLQRTDFLDLGPYPDAVEYFAQANSIMKEGAPTIQIGYDKLPSRYPPGYPLLMIPWLSCLPHHGILAPFRTNQTIGLLLLIGSFGFYFAIGRVLAGGLGTLLLATQPSFITFSRSSLSDLSGATAAILAVVLVYLAFRQMRRWPIYAAAVVLGLALCIRPQLLFFSPILIAAALFPAGDSWPKWVLHCCLTGLVFVAASVPYFAFNTLEFGNPLKTGYNFWVPGWAENARLFSLHNVPAQLAMLWSDLSASWTDFRVANLFGTGTYIVAPLVLLALFGVAFVRVNRFTVSAFAGAISYFAATLTYAFVDGRFFLPLFLLLVPLAILPSEYSISNVLKLRFSPSTVGIVVVLLLTLFGYPSQSGFKPEKNRSQTWDALQYARSNGRSPQYEAQRQFGFSFRHAPGIVLSDTDPPYLNALLPKTFVAAPIDEKHDYRFSRQWHYGKAEAIRLVEGGLNRGVPIYALFVPSQHIDQDVGRLPQIQGYTWKRSGRSNATALIMILTKQTSVSLLDPVTTQRG